MGSTGSPQAGRSDVAEWRSRALAHGWVARLWERRWSAFWMAVLVVYLLVIFDFVNTFAPMRTASALAHGRSVLSFEGSLGIHWERTSSQWLVAHRTLAFYTNWAYNIVQICVTTTVFVVLWWRRPKAYNRLRWVLLGANVVAGIVFWLYAVAPPRLIPGSGVADTVAQVPVKWGWGVGILPNDPGQFQALPSLHAAWATLVPVAIFALTRKRWARAIAVVYTPFVGMLIVVTGAHSVTDFVLGASLTLLLTGLVALVSRRRDRAPEETPDGPPVADTEPSRRSRADSHATAA